MHLQGKTVLITGSTGGIGSALTIAFHFSGAKVLLLGLDKEKLMQQAKELNTQYYVCDLSNELDIQKTIENVQNDHKSLDILVNNAGIGIYKPFEEISEEDWELSYKINVKAPFLLAKGLLPVLKKSAESMVINIGSTSGVNAIENKSIYCTNKFALRGWSLSLSKEFEKKWPKFMHITLGSVMTEFGPLTLEEKKKLKESGKGYLEPAFVADEIVKVTKTPLPHAEVEILP